MSYQWEARWVRKRLELGGISIEVCVDESTGLIACPVCIDVDKLCPPGKRVSVQPPEGVAYFYSVEDLLNHLKAHSEEFWGRERRRRAEELEEVEEHEEEVEEEE